MGQTLGNSEVAATFKLLADLLEIRGETVFKVTAYRRAAESIANLHESVEAVRARGELGAIPGVGSAIESKIEDLLDRGTFKLLDEVRTEFPPGVAELLAVPEIGPKRARLLYQELGIDSLDALREAVEDGRLQGLGGLGPKGAQRIAEGLRALPMTTARLPLGMARGLGLQLVELLLEHADSITRIELAGSVRRFCETVGDLNIVAATERPGEVLDAYSRLPSAAQVESKADDHCRIRLHNGFAAELHVTSERRWGTLLQARTGSAAHNARLRILAADRGLTMDERGIGRGGELVACATEEAVYEFLGMQFVPPPMREDTGEVELALEGRLPEPFRADLLRGDLHTHTEWSDGTRTVREMALAARERGYEYICITDHSQSLGVANGLTPERLARQRREIDALNAELAPFRVLQGVECEVMGDGSLDLPDEALAALDLVIASVHSGLRQGRERVMARAIKAIQHPLVDILAHPTGRIVGGRSGGDFDMETLIAEAARTRTTLEINSDPARLDLRDTHARSAAQAGCTISIDTDAHSTEGLNNTFYGAGLATRAWIQPEQVLNTLSLDEMLGRLKRNRGWD